MTGFLKFIYLETGQGEFKKRFYNHNKSFKNNSKRNDMTLAKYAWDLKFELKI